MSIKSKSNSDENALCVFIKLKSEEINNEKFFTVASINSQLKKRLPWYMLPDLIMIIKKMPLTKNNKIDRKFLKKKIEEELIQECLTEVQSSDNFITNLTQTQKTLIEILNQIIETRQQFQSTDINTNFKDMGVHSLSLMRYASALKKMNFERFNGIIDLFTYCSIGSLAKYLDGDNDKKNEIEIDNSILREKSETINKIAITGIAFRLPNDTQTVIDFWNILQNEKSIIKELPENRSKDIMNSFLERRRNKISVEYVPFFEAGFLDRIDMFDNKLFGISPTEATDMAPEQRLWTEVIIYLYSKIF